MNSIGYILTQSILAAGTPYNLTPVMDVPNRKAWYMFIIDPETGAQVPIVWTDNDETKFKDMDYTGQVNFIYNFAKNSIDSLTDLLAQNRGEFLDDPIENVEWDN